VLAAAWRLREGLMPGEVKNASSHPVVLEPTGGMKGWAPTLVPGPYQDSDQCSGGTPLHASTLPGLNRCGSAKSPLPATSTPYDCTRKSV
jgi:hypothetical protein